MSGKAAVSAVVVAACALAFVGGCFYSWGPLTDPAYKTVYMPIFRNETTERHVENDLTEALRRVYNEAGSWRVTSDPDRADLVLTGRVVRFQRTPLSETREDNVLELQVSVTADVRLTDARTGQIIRDRVISESGDATLILGQTEEEATREALNDVAKKIYEALERNWF